MRKHRARFILTFSVGLAIILAGAVFATVLVSRHREPQYQGRSLSSWYQLYESTRDRTDAKAPADAEQADRAIKEIGTNAIPLLLKALRYEASPLRNRLAPYQLGNSYLHRTALKLDSLLYPQFGADPIFVFAILREKGAPAIPELARLLQSTTNRFAINRISYALAATGPKAVPALVAAISRPEPVFRLEVVQWLASAGGFDFGTNLAQAAPILVKCSTDTNTDVAIHAIRALGRINTCPEIVLPALTNVLSSANSAIREAATNSLRSVAPDLITNAPSQ